jgi:hypothetical protein
LYDWTGTSDGDDKRNEGKDYQKAKSLGASLVNFAPASRWEDFDEVLPEYRPTSLRDKVKTVIVIIRSSTIAEEYHGISYSLLR